MAVRHSAGPKLRSLPLLGALFVVRVGAGYLVAADTSNDHALGPDIRHYDSEPQHQIAACLVALGAVPLLSSHGLGAGDIPRGRD